MISLIEAKSYRCLRYVRQPLGNFQILVGPNASGKSTFIDVVAFLGDILRLGVEDAVRRRARSLSELVWLGQGESLEVAVELKLPRPEGEYSVARYEVRVGKDDNDGVALQVENFWLIRNGAMEEHTRMRQPVLFPHDIDPPRTIVIEPGKRTPAGYRKVVSRTSEGRVYIRSETTDWNFSLRPARGRAGLILVPEEEERFRAATWARKLLLEGIQMLMLNSLLMRSPCAPDMPSTFQPDGSNLPVVVGRLRRERRDRFDSWVEHIRTVFPDIIAIEEKGREEDRYRYLLVELKTGVKLPSWSLSDGTLRFLALTLLPYLPDSSGVYLIEEPEKGGLRYLHPSAT